MSVGHNLAGAHPSSRRLLATIDIQQTGPELFPGGRAPRRRDQIAPIPLQPVRLGSLHHTLSPSAAENPVPIPPAPDARKTNTSRRCYCLPSLRRFIVARRVG